MNDAKQDKVDEAMDELRRIITEQGQELQKLDAKVNELERQLRRQSGSGTEKGVVAK